MSVVKAINDWLFLESSLLLQYIYNTRSHDVVHILAEYLA